MRGAEYLGDGGRLSVDRERLLFISDGQHAAVEDLEKAARSAHPRRALAEVVAQASSGVPPFVFVLVTDRLQGMVCGPIQLRIDTDEVVTVDGAAADPWERFDTPTSSTLTCGDPGFRGSLWVGLGVVAAGGFRWSPRHNAPSTRDRTESQDPASAEGLEGPREESLGGAESSQREDSASTDARVEDTVTQGGTPSAGSVGSAEGLRAETSLLDALHLEFDATIDAIRFAEVRNTTRDNEPPKLRNSGRETSAGSASAMPAGEAAAATVDETTTSPADTGVDEGATIDLAPGQVMLEGLHAERRMVQALVCLGCDSPNPPATVRCRSCAVMLSSNNTDLRDVPQPVLGVIHLSGGREELLDTDLVIGRNPASRPLDRHQRAVVHAADDRSVSRRHIELKLDQWKVMVINLKQGASTIRQARDGSLVELVPGTPQRLWPGDTIHYGGAWLRYEPEE